MNRKKNETSILTFEKSITLGGGFSCGVWFSYVNGGNLPAAILAGLAGAGLMILYFTVRLLWERYQKRRPK